MWSVAESPSQNAVITITRGETIKCIRINASAWNTNMPQNNNYSSRNRSGAFRMASLLLMMGIILPGNKGMDPMGKRFPPPSVHLPLVTNPEEDTCVYLCVSPGHGNQPYPIGHQLDIELYARFIVPELPQEHDPISTTYYNYFNIFWRTMPMGGYYNQFVPQLMLGNALANSTNHPDYTPQWLALTSWHIGAQYFMGICKDRNRNHNFRRIKNFTIRTDQKGLDSCDTTTTSSWIPKAVTGELIAVEPGEMIETYMALIPSSSGDNTKNPYGWRLQIGVVNQPHRTSVIFVDRPFMGLIKSTTTWMEDIYQNVNVGSCLENYGISRRQQYPPTWDLVVDIWPTEKNMSAISATNRRQRNVTAASFWRPWSLEDHGSCSWEPKSMVASVEEPLWQRAVWKAAYQQNYEKRETRTSLWPRI